VPGRTRLGRSGRDDCRRRFDPGGTILRKVTTNIKGHRLEVQRVSHVDSRLSYAELSETFDIDGVAKTWPECILFEQGDDGLISRVSVFFKQRQADTP
jgi:hypothetical protein